MSGQGAWQLLPLGPTGLGNSPYQSLSSFAGNPLLISLDALITEGWLSEEEIPLTRHVAELSEDRVNYVAVGELKRSALALAFERFPSRAHDQQTAFARFCEEEADWLDDFSLFMALKEEHGGASWDSWEPGARYREPAALSAWGEVLRHRAQEHRFYQYLFFRQWRQLRDHAKENKVTIIGDMPIFVAFDGADVWAHPDLFFLDNRLSPTVVAGVPPDYFSETGQLWGNPLYRWDRMAEDGYDWWIKRLKKSLELVDIVRLDHFRAFEAYWEVPASETTAESGRWVKGPGEKLLETLQRALGRLPLIAEDLGLITPEVEALRDAFGQPGMKVLHFAFGDTASNPYLPHNHVPNCVVYTGTHDNDTTLGWFTSLNADERRVIERYLGHDSVDICWDLIRLAFSSVADTAIVPVQDLLCLGSESRMNTPGTPEGNWEWRLRPGALTLELARRLKRTTALYGRLNTPPHVRLRDLTDEDSPLQAS